MESSHRVLHASTLADGSVAGFVLDGPPRGATGNLIVVAPAAPWNERTLAVDLPTPPLGIESDGEGVLWLARSGPLGRGAEPPGGRLCRLASMEAEVECLSVVPEDCVALAVVPLAGGKARKSVGIPVLCGSTAEFLEIHGDAWQAR
jgi:hypothetical protein